MCVCLKKLSLCVLCELYCVMVMFSLCVCVGLGFTAFVNFENELLCAAVWCELVCLCLLVWVLCVCVVCV